MMKTKLFFLFNLLITKILLSQTVLLDNNIGNGGFENGNTEWTITNDNYSVNRWVISNTLTGGFSGNKCIYVTNSLQAPYSNAYDMSDYTSNAIFYKDIVFPAGNKDYILTFKLLVNGSTDDKLSFGFGSGLNSSSISTLLGEFSKEGFSWVNKKVEIKKETLGNVSSSVTKRLIFRWQNIVNSTAALQPPAAIDDIKITDCINARNITRTTATSSSITLDWQSYDTSWNIKYRLTGSSDNWAEATINTKPYTITGLTHTKSYDVQIQNATFDCNTWSDVYTLKTTPPNYSCATATDIVPYIDLNSTDSYVGNMNGAIYNSQLPICENYATPDKEVWFKFIATSNRHVLESPYNLLYQLYSGDCSNLNYIKCYSGSSYLDNLTSGNTYYLRVLKSDIDAFSFKLETPKTPPAHDLCANAITLEEGADFVNVNYNGSTIDNGFVSTCNNFVYDDYKKDKVFGDVWYKFTATQSSYKLIHKSQLVIFDLYEDSCNGSMINCGQITNSYRKDINNLKIGKTYYLRVYNDRFFYDYDNLFIKLVKNPVPSNDNCDGATNFNFSPGVPFYLPGYSTLDTSLANPSTNLVVPNCIISSATNPNLNDIWFKFKPYSSGYLITGLSEYSQFVIYKNTCDNLEEIACVPSNSKGIVITGLDTANYYYIRFLGSYSYNSIKFEEWQDNDECSGAIEVISAESNPKKYTSTLINSSNSNSTISCSTVDNANDVWFSFIAKTKKANILFERTWNGDSFQYAISLYKGNCDGFEYISCKSGTLYSDITWEVDDLIVGQKYYYKVYSSNGNDSSLIFNTEIIQIPDAPANDLFENAQTIIPDNNGQCTLINGTLVSSTPTSGFNFCNTTTNDAWYKFTATSTKYKIDTFDFDNWDNYHYTTIDLFEGSSLNNLKTIKCYLDYNRLSGFEIGKTYYIRVIYATNNTFSLCVSAILETPVNDECINAENINVQNDYSDISYTNGTLTNATLPITQLSQSCTNYESYDNYNNYVDVWYKFTASSVTHVLAYKDLYYPMDAATFTYDIYEGGCDNLKCITPKYNIYNSDYIGFGDNKKILNNLTPGKEYYIRIGNTKSAFNQKYNYQIAILTAPQNLGDDINSPITIAPSSTTNCESETMLYTGLASPSTALNVSGCSSMFNPYLINDGQITKYYDTWLEFTANNSELILKAPVLVQLFSGSPTQLLCEGNNLAREQYNSNYTGYYLLKNLTVGKKYYLRIIEQENNSFSEYKICLKKSYPVPINDEYENAISLIPSNSINECNANTYLVNRASLSTNVASPTCYTYGVNDVWYKFVANSTTTQLNIIVGNDPLYSNTTNPLNLGRPVLYRKNSQNIFEQVYCYNSSYYSNDYFLYYNEAAKLYTLASNFTNLNIGETYYIRIMLPDNSQLKQDLNLTLCLKNFNNTPPENDNISSATEIMVSPTESCNFIQGNAFLSTADPSTPQYNSADLCYDYPGNKDVWYKFNTLESSIKINYKNLGTIPYPYGTGDIPLPYITVFEDNGQNGFIRIKCFYPTINDFNNLIIDNLNPQKIYYIRIMPNLTVSSTSAFSIPFEICLSKTTLSTDEEFSKSEISIFPNPVKDVLNFKTKEKIKKAEIYDLNGGLLKVELGISNNQLNVSSLKTGNYIVKILTDKKSYQTKFIKQ